MKDFAIVVQGPSNYVPQIKKYYRGYPLVFSTWKGEEGKYTQDDVVVFNDIPSIPGPGNFWMQQSSTINGLRKAKELGYKNVLKMRSDIVPNSCEKFLSTLKEDHLNFLSWHAHEVYPGCKGYLVDYFMSGNIDHLITLWDITEIFCVVPEIVLTWQYILQLKNLVPTNFMLEQLDDNNDLYWLKRQLFISSYRNPKIDPYKKYTFNIDISNLKENYLNFLKKR